MAKGLDIMDTFRSASADTSSLFDMGHQMSNQSVNTAITFEDLFPDVNVSLPDVEVPDVNVHQAELPDFNVAGVSQAVDGVKNTVLDKVEQLQNFFLKSLQNDHGRDAGNQMMGKALACGGTSLAQAAVTVLDPTPGVIAVAMAVHAENKGPKTPAIEAAMDEIISNARQNSSANQAKVADANNDAPKVPEGIDLDGVTGKQMFEFFQTPVEDLPIMRKISEIEHGVDCYTDKLAYVEENGHETVNADKLAVADDAELAEMAGSEAEVAEFVVEHSADLEYGSGAVDMICSGLEAPGLLTCTAPEFATKAEIDVALAEVEKDAAPSFDNESALRAAAQVFKPEDATMGA